MSEKPSINANAKKLSDLPYEEAINELKKIIEETEAGEIPLEDMVKNYNIGMNLLKHCQSQLEKAEFKMHEQDSNSEVNC